ncbi:MAG: hypothetical protein WDZ83_14420 [Rhizobiaceae bacterium]
MLIIGTVIGVHPVYAVDFTAGIVVTKMAERDRYPFLAGIIEGLAYARYKKDGDSTDGMRCIYEWFYDTKERQQEILDTFSEFADYTPAAVVAAMVKKECGA